MKNLLTNRLQSLAFTGMLFIFLSGCSTKEKDSEYYTLTSDALRDKIKGAWAAQTIGVTYGGPTEFRYNKRMIPDEVELAWSDTMMYHWMTRIPGLYDDIYMDLTFVEVMEREGIDAPASSHAKAFAEAKYALWHANQQGRYNFLNGMTPPETGHWLNNPHADDIDFQIEADFAGIMNPGMPNSALDICDKVGHIMNSGDGYYGGVLMAAMYSYAFVDSDIPAIVNNALSHIPQQSTFYQCIADVIKWHSEHPDDWKKNWQLIEEKWGHDIGCPDGVDRDFNIDAKINAAYVVLGLLYGHGDLAKTMEISTRAGQDSDCNPASSGAIIGTIIGYKNIPEYWSKGLPLIEDMDFKYTTISLNDAYAISYKHALEMIERNGGVVDGNTVKIKKSPKVIAPLEQNFEGYVLNSRDNVNVTIGHKDAQEYEVDFEGIGVVLTGRTQHEKVETEEENALIRDYVLEVECYLDGELSKTMRMPLDFTTRAHEIYFKYEIPDGQHKLRLNILNPHELVSLQIDDLISYGKK